jgi:hypothetical protein
MISDTDLRDWKETFPRLTPELEPRKLYDVPKNSIISLVENPKQLLNFFHVDGAYSFCKLFGTNDVVHLAAWADVYVWDSSARKL